MSDYDLAGALRAGDGDLFAALVNAWSPAMLSLARLYEATPPAAESLVQEAWLAALRALERYDGTGSLRAWVMSKVVERATETGRQLPAFPSGPTVAPDRFQGPGGRFPGGWQQFPDEWPGDADPTPLAALVAGLPRAERAVIELRDVHGYSGEEVAAMLNVAVADQRSLLHHARASARAGFDQHFAPGA